jgi:hypothetical protein
VTLTGAKVVRGLTYVKVVMNHVVVDDAGRPYAAKVRRFERKSTSTHEAPRIGEGVFDLGECAVRGDQRCEEHAGLCGPQGVG